MRLHLVGRRLGNETELQRGWAVGRSNYCSPGSTSGMGEDCGSRPLNLKPLPLSDREPRGMAAGARADATAVIEGGGAIARRLALRQRELPDDRELRPRL